MNVWTAIGRESFWKRYLIAMIVLCSCSSLKFMQHVSGAEPCDSCLMFAIEGFNTFGVLVHALLLRRISRRGGRRV